MSVSGCSGICSGPDITASLDKVTFIHPVSLMKSLSCDVQNGKGRAGLGVGHGAGHQVKLSPGGLGAEADPGGHGVNLFTGHEAELRGRVGGHGVDQTLL